MSLPRSHDNSLRRSLSHSEGETSRDNNDDMRSRALRRYHELLKTDAQLQVTVPLL
jgi:hypothetical protein